VAIKFVFFLRLKLRSSMYS